MKKTKKTTKICPLTWQSMMENFLTNYEETWGHVDVVPQKDGENKSV